MNAAIQLNEAYTAYGNTGEQYSQLKTHYDAKYKISWFLIKKHRDRVLHHHY